MTDIKGFFMSLMTSEYMLYSLKYIMFNLWTFTSSLKNIKYINIMTNTVRLTLNTWQSESTVRDLIVIIIF